jgi:hypothetical protein
MKGNRKTSRCSRSRDGFRWLIALGAMVLSGLAPDVSASSSSASYRILHESVDAGGRRATGGLYTADASLGGVFGISAASVGDSMARAGYAGQLNEAPVPRTDAIERPSGHPVKLQVTKILANDSDWEGDAITLSLPGNSSDAGGTVSTSDGWVFYLPPSHAPHVAEDSFQYRVTDSYGGTALGRIVVLVSNPQETAEEIENPPNRLIWEREGNLLKVTFLGIPGATYKLQYRASISAGDVWQDYPNSSAPHLQVAGANGLYLFTIHLAGEQGFFRAVPHRP